MNQCGKKEYQNGDPERMRKILMRGHDRKRLNDFSEASGLSVMGIKQSAIDLCKKLDMEWPLSNNLLIRRVCKEFGIEWPLKRRTLKT